jgi:RNA polymerase subunit RPABC4/transcription elongation factor Spt4
MIFIGGVQPKTRLVEKTPRACPSCGLAQAYVKRTAHYISLFFIPLIPISKGETFLACEACGAVFDQQGQTIRPPTPEEKHCAGCGESVNPSFSYCPYCGRHL